MPKFEPLPLSGAYVITLEPIGDRRGYFVETYRADAFAKHGLATDWLQENQSLSSRKHTLRGLHLQMPPYSQAKLFRVLQGAVLDVIVDVRVGSSTYGQHAAVEISDSNNKLIYIPHGFAHGFCTLTEDVIVSYKVDAYYAPQSEAGLLWNDPALSIDWPCETPILSEKDGQLPTLAEFESPFVMSSAQV
jgi:dTDP-4-dehydrorhamnose 3,5-epimerase